MAAAAAEDEASAGAGAVFADRLFWDDVNRFKLRPREPLFKASACTFKNKEHKGKLFVTSERIAWQRNGILTPQFEAAIPHILRQRISNKRPKLGIMIKDVEMPMFEFPSREVMDDLTTFLEKARRNNFGDAKPLRTGEVKDEGGMRFDPERSEKMAREERERKQREAAQKYKNAMAELLDNNAMLKEMFVSLKDQGVKPTEFFKALEKELAADKDIQLTQGPRQELGVPSGLLSQLKVQRHADGGRNVRMTPDIIDGFFKLYPLLKEKHAEITAKGEPDNAFWTAVLESHYLNRGAKSLVDPVDSHDPLAEMEVNMRQSEETRNLKRMPGNPLVDLTADRDDLREGYGPYAKDEDVERGHIRKRQLRNLSFFNADSERLLALMDPNHEKAHMSAVASGTGEAGTAGLVSLAAESRSRLDRHLREALSLEDLAEEPPSKAPKLRVDELRANASKLGAAPAGQATLGIVQPSALPGYDLPTTQQLHLLPESAADALEHMCQVDLRDDVPFHGVSEKLAQVLQQYEQAFSTLLYHFWRCFPPDKEAPKGAVAEKARHFGQQLLQYQKNKLEVILAELAPEERPLFANLTRRVEQAVATYQTWSV